MLLYIVYDSDLVTIAKNRNELTLAFVDDMVLVAIARTFQDTHGILTDMLEREGGAYKWSADHNSRFETSKFGLVDFTLSKTKPRPPMKIRGNVITPAPAHKFLGVIVDQELRWKEHAAYALAKGASYAALLRRLSRSAHGIPAGLTRQLYRSIAIPKMLYAASIWIKLLLNGDSSVPLRGSQGIAKKMTQVQRTVALVITGAMKTSPNRLYRSTRKPSANATTPATPASQRCHMPSVKTPIAPAVQANQMCGQAQRQTPQDGTSPHPPQPQDKPGKNRDHFPTPPSSHITDPVYHRHRKFKGGSQRRVSKMHEPHDGIHRRIKPQRPSGSRRSSLH